MKLNFIKINKNFVLLLFILIVATILRLFSISSNPPSLTWDETAWGYNAYSIGIDGKDEFGRFLPHDYLESFGDFKPPMYAYLDVIPVKFFGLNEFATRFPSAIFGILTVLISYFLVKRIFPNAENKEKYALFSSLFLAISPWHIMLSRAAFEANVATFFIVAGVWAFLAGIQDKKWYLLISAVSFALSMYTFNTSRIVSPMLVLMLILVFRKKLLTIKKEAFIALVFGFIIFLPTLGFLITPQAGLRFKEVNIFSDSNVVKTSNQEVANNGSSIWSKVLDNRRVFFTLSFFNHYFDNLSPKFLFVKGDGNPKFSVQDNGQMYFWDIIFLVGGVFILLRRKEGNWWLIPVWLLLGIIPAATARETPHALRIETTLPTFQILVTVGFVNLLAYLKKWRSSITAVLYILLFVNVLYFAHNLFVHYPLDYSGEWQYGYKDAYAFAKSVEGNFDEIDFTQALGRPYIYYLFYNKVSPDDFRKNANVLRDPFGFVTVKSVGKYSFPSAFSYNNKNKKTLYINTPDSIPAGASVLKTFKLLNGKDVLVAYELK